MRELEKVKEKVTQNVLRGKDNQKDLKKLGKMTDIQK
jgi:hypothetical protein